jgi:hypothetical protein
MKTRCVAAASPPTVATTEIADSWPLPRADRTVDAVPERSARKSHSHRRFVSRARVFKRDNVEPAAFRLWSRRNTGSSGVTSVARMRDAVSRVYGVAQIDACETRARAGGDAYWAAQIAVQSKEARAWGANASGHADVAVALLRAAADAEDALEKLPVTPGPIVPAREQLGQLLLDLQRPGDALRELTQALKDAPGRRAGLEAAARAAEGAGDPAAAAAFRKRLAT